MIYKGYQDSIRCEQDSVLTSTKWEDLMTGIHITLSGVEIYDFIGAGERYYDAFCRIFHKLKFEANSKNYELIVSAAVKAISITMNPQGLVSSPLFFEVLSRFLGIHTKLPYQKYRMQSL